MYCCFLLVYSVLLVASLSLLYFLKFSGNNRFILAIYNFIMEERMRIDLRSSCKCVVFVFALISLAGCNGRNESESTSKDTSAKFKIVQGLASPVPNSLIPFTSPDGKFKISFPRGWELLSGHTS